MYAAVKAFVKKNPKLAERIIALSEKTNRTLNGLGRATTEQKEILSFDEVLQKYNSQITQAEIEAWVWYCMKNGKAMNGKWNSYKTITKVEHIDKHVKNGTLFVHDDEYLPKPVYTFGNIYDRLLQLEQDKEKIIQKYGISVYEQHQKELEAAKPKMLSVADVDENNRPKILCFSKFAREFIIPQDVVDAEDWVAKGHSLYTVFTEAYLPLLAKTEKQHFTDVSAWAIVHYYIKNKNFGKNDSQEYRDNVRQYAPIVAERLFSKMLYELPASVRQKIDFTWNRLNNGFSALQTQRIPIGFECSRYFKKGDFAFSEAQKEAIGFLQVAGGGVIAYDVGVGKTISLIISLANEMYAGRCKRPLIVVPNPTYKKWIGEIFGYTDSATGEKIYGVLSGTNIELNDWYNLGSSYMSKAQAQKRVKEGTITIVTYEGFNKIGYSDAIMEDLFLTLSEVLFQYDENEKGNKRDLSKEQQKWKELLGYGRKDTFLNIDELGFDYIAIDEAHNFKNVFSYVPKDDEGNKRFSIETAQSSRAIRAFFICNYIQKTYGKNVVLLTATPFSNNPIEIYSILSLVGYDNLYQYGVSNLYDFVEYFIHQSYEYVNSYDGKIVQKYIVKGYNNRLVLQRLIRNHINYKTGEQAGVKRPFKINLPKISETNKEGIKIKLSRRQQLQTFLKQSPTQEENQAYIQNYPSNFSGFEKLRAVMKCLAWNLDNALSPFIYDTNNPPKDCKEFVNESPKIKYTMECIRSVKKWHEKKGQNPSGQVIYMNRGKEFFKYIKEYLEEELGYKSKIKFQSSVVEKAKNTYVDEVEIITSSVSQEDREIIKEAFLAGICKVVIGTASIREGIDLQNNGTVLYNLYPDWNPTDMKQLEGRIWRRGNAYGFVRIVTPLVQDTMDVFIYQKLEEKTERLKDIWNTSADGGNVIDLGESIDPDEVKFALFTNINELMKVELDKLKRELKKKLVMLNDEIEAVKEVIGNIKRLVEYREVVEEYVLKCKQPLSKFKELVGIFPDKFKGLEDKMADYEERANEIVASIEAWENEIPKDDKKLIAIYSRLNTSIFQTRGIVEYFYGHYKFESFKGAHISLEKAKTGFFQKNGYSIDTDFQKVWEDLYKNGQMIENEIAHLDSDEFKAKLKEEIVFKKEESQIEGRHPADATEDFESLNHLLSYPFNDAINYSEIPQKEYQAGASYAETTVPQADNGADKDRERKKKLAIAKAKALKLKLELLRL